MSAPRIEALVVGPGGLEPFERVRQGVGLYGGVGPEPIAAGTDGLIAWRGTEPVARASLHLADHLHGAPGRSGMIGHYEALDAEAGVAVLSAACRILAERAAARVLGPMNGSTWARYRLALRPATGAVEEDPPPFLTEPWNPARYPEDFAAAGFAIEARYESRVDEALGHDAADAADLEAKVRAAGLRVRPLDLGRFDEELTTLFDLSLAAFADNPFYTPIDAPAFRAQYQRVRPLIDPELVLIAEDATGAAVGFQFAFRDPLAPRGAPPRTVVKTVATAPAARGRGLAGHMLDRLRRRARDSGCGSVIHALMHVQNFSMRMSARHESRSFRRYALYRWTP